MLTVAHIALAVLAPATSSALTATLYTAANGSWSNGTLVASAVIPVMGLSQTAQVGKMVVWHEAMGTGYSWRVTL